MSLLDTALNSPVVWETARLGLDLWWGLYRKRQRLMRDWGLLHGSPSVLDVGCGIGQYAACTSGDYLGLDLEPRYIAHAQRVRGGPTRQFRVQAAEQLIDEGRKFEIVLIVDFLHHLPDDASVQLLKTARTLAKTHVVNFEPIRPQRTRLGRWLVEHDRGKHIRTREHLESLVERSGASIRRAVPLQLGPSLSHALLLAP